MTGIIGEIYIIKIKAFCYLIVSFLAYDVIIFWQISVITFGSILECTDIIKNIYP